MSFHEILSTFKAFEKYDRLDKSIDATKVERFSMYLHWQKSRLDALQAVLESNGIETKGEYNNSITDNEKALLNASVRYYFNINGDKGKDARKEV